MPIGFEGFNGDSIRLWLKGSRRTAARNHGREKSCLKNAVLLPIVNESRLRNLGSCWEQAILRYYTMIRCSAAVLSFKMAISSVFLRWWHRHRDRFEDKYCVIYIYRTFKCNWIRFIFLWTADDKEYFWSGIDYSSEEPFHLTFWAQLSSMDVALDFKSILESCQRIFKTVNFDDWVLIDFFMSSG